MRFDRLLFGIFYRFGFTPWEGHALPARLKELVEGTNALRAGTALDIGCGTGDTSIYLARHGWTVTAFDWVQVAVNRAQAKAAAAGVQIRLLQADVTALSSYGVGSGFQLLVDNGCLHGLSDDGRDAYVQQISSAAASGATLLLAGFAESDRRRPRGFNRPEIERRFASGWELVSASQDPAMSKRVNDPIYIYELRRKAAP